MNSWWRVLGLSEGQLPRDLLVIISTTVGYFLLWVFGGWEIALGTYLVLAGYAELVVRNRP